MGKITSLVIFIIYLISAYISGGGVLLLRVLAFLLLPMACIWFGDELGRYTGIAVLRPIFITEESPGCLVKFVGWILLLLPAIFATASFIMKIR